MSSSQEHKTTEDNSCDADTSAEGSIDNVQEELLIVIDRLNVVSKFCGEWFELKEREITLRNEMAMVAENFEDSSETEQDPLGGSPEIIHDTSGPIDPASFDQSDANKVKTCREESNVIGGLEIVQNDDGPAAPTLFQYVGDGKKSSGAVRNTVHEAPEIIQNVDAPVSAASFEETVAAKEEQNARCQEDSEILNCCDESIIHPSRNDIEEGILQNEHTGHTREENIPAIELLLQNDITPMPTPIEEVTTLNDI